ncbi:hypothetical protein MMC07_007255 [Pseudocyphellaria aurata]|nr:hypothetical protein [Pseudocyphellaria aurata]
MAPRGPRKVLPLASPPTEVTSPVTLTPQQSAQGFEIQCQNLQNERDLAIRKSELELDCIRNESQARIAAASTAAAATTRAQAAGPEDDDLGVTYETYQDKDRVDIEDGTLKLKKKSGTYKHFGKSVQDVWSAGFLNYAMIMVSLFGQTNPDLHAALFQFHGTIIELSQVYEWQEAVLPLAIEAHTYITTLQPTDPTQWVFHPEFQGRFCN